MKITTQLKGTLLLFITTLCFVSGSQAQQWDRNRMKIELSVQDGKKTVVSNLTTLSISFNKPAMATDSTNQQIVDDYNPCYIVITFDRLDIPLLRLFMQKNTNLNGKIMVTDSYGKLPTRKIELNSIVMDGMNDNFINEEETSYMNLSCKELIIDDVVLKK